MVGVRARAIQLPADGKRGIEAGGLRTHYRHRGRRGFPVGARQQKCPAIGHECGEHVGAADDGDPSLAGGGELGIILRNRGERGHDNRRQLRATGDVRSVVSDSDVRPGCTQRQDAARVLHVGAGDAVAPCEQNSGDAGHPGPADAHHVGAAQINLFRLRGHGILNLCGKAVAVKWGSWWPRQGKVTCWCRGSVSG